MTDAVVRYGINQRGRDFIVGDIHGSYELLKNALKKSGFSVGRDRLFSVGDLIDRGPESDRVLIFLDWLTNGNGAAVRGNHEQMLVDIYAKGDPDPAVEEFMYSHNGMSWLSHQDPSWRRQAAMTFSNLPWAIEIETTKGMVGLVHADVPIGMSWQDFTMALESHDKSVRDEVRETALWSRDRMAQDDKTGVSGIGRVFVGHTPINCPKRLGNIFYIDTGAVFGLKTENPEDGRLTIADIVETTTSFDLSREEIAGLDHIITLKDNSEIDKPFGRYFGI